MSITKAEFESMAGDLREVIIDLKHRYRIPDPIMEKLERVTKELSAEGYTMREETIEDDRSGYVGTVED